ncbi:IS66 family insertion sequence element accessory protein TnpB [Dysosmobacter sp.]|uniref:IS66 family insertion sequence element accessory protein TnpB n=1 Tax=Eubacteriales TaxID=186802 RepID=UPI0039C70AF8
MLFCPSIRERGQFELDPFTNTLFLSCGRKRDRIKGLYWERDGFILLYKRPEQGTYQWRISECIFPFLMWQKRNTPIIPSFPK